MCWHLCLTGVTMAGRASSVMNVCFILDASTGPATSLGSATVRGTGVACCVIKVWKGFWFLFVYFIYFFHFIASHTRHWHSPHFHPACVLQLQFACIWWVTSKQAPQSRVARERTFEEGPYRHAKCCSVVSFFWLEKQAFLVPLLAVTFSICWAVLKCGKQFKLSCL